MDEDLIGPPLRKKRQPISALHKLLVQAVPPNLTAVSAAVGLTDEAVYRWIRLNRIPPLPAARIVDASEGRVTLADFYPYIFLENHDA